MEFSFGGDGSEANIALALANLGVDSSFFSVVPNNSLGKSAVRMLRAKSVLPGMYVMPTAAAKTACRLICGIRVTPLRASCSPSHSGPGGRLTCIVKEEMP